MKSGIHPKYAPVAITCACGNVIETRSTRPGITVEICSNCHPFFTGKQKIVDAAGRVERFTAKYKNVQPAQKKEAPAPIQPRQVIPKIKPVVPIAAPKPSELARSRGPRPGSGRPGGPGGRPGAGPRGTGGPRSAQAGATESRPARPEAGATPSSSKPARPEAGARPGSTPAGAEAAGRPGASRPAARAKTAGRPGSSKPAGAEARPGSSSGGARPGSAGAKPESGGEPRP